MSIGVLIRQLFAMEGLELGAVHGIIVASVVPPLDRLLRQVCERYFRLKALFIEPGIKTGCRCTMTIRQKWAPTAL